MSTESKSKRGMMLMLAGVALRCCRIVQVVFAQGVLKDFHFFPSNSRKEQGQGH